MREKILYTLISLLMAAGLLTAVPALAQTTQPAQGQGVFGGPRGGMQHAPGVFGTVSAISGDTITVQSKGFGQNASATTYTVDATNATVTKSGSTSSVSDIAVGDTVMVQGTVSGDNVTATKINDGVPSGTGQGQGGFGGMRPGVFGTVSAISGTTLTVTSKAMVGPNNASSNTSATTYTVDASNATVMKDNATSTVSAIAVGDTVMVQGTVSGDNVTATMIRDGVVPQMQGKGAGGGALASLQGNGEPVIGGSVSAISGETLTVTNKSNVTYSVDATNATVIKGNATSSVASISTGDNVIVQGTVDGTSVTASSVIDQGAAPSSESGSGSGGPGPAVMRSIGGAIGAIGGFFQHLFGFF